MKKAKWFASLLLIVCLLLSLSAYALAADYQYTVTISGGLHGTVDGQPSISFTVPYGTAWNPNDYLSRVKVTDEKYYFKNTFHVSGQEGDALATTITQDTTFVANFGVMGSQVAYNVHYVTTAGAELLPTATFYGNAGDKPVVAYRYVEGYEPQAYNITFTLVEGETRDINFIYTPIAAPAPTPTPVPAQQQQQNPVVPQQPAANQPAANQPAANQPAANQPGGNEADNTQGNQPQTETLVEEPVNNEPVDLIDLDDEDVPLAAPDFDTSNTAEGQAKDARKNFWLAITAGGVGLAAILYFLWFALLGNKSKKKKGGTAMSERHTAPRREQKKGGRFLPALCSVVGTVIILAVIALLLPMSVPKLLGYEVYNVVSGSMYPAIPQGSMVLVRPTEWNEIAEGDVIAFESNGTVVTHRVTKVRVVEGEFITKGDANEDVDITPIPFSDLIGRVERHIPVLGELTAHVSTAVGKIYLFALLVCGVLFHVLANRLREA